jgi:hypothetical protein
MDTEAGAADRRLPLLDAPHGHRTDVDQHGGVLEPLDARPFPEAAQRGTHLTPVAADRLTPARHAHISLHHEISRRSYYEAFVIPQESSPDRFEPN